VIYVLTNLLEYIVINIKLITFNILFLSYGFRTIFDQSFIPMVFMCVVSEKR